MKNWLLYAQIWTYHFSFENPPLYQLGCQSLISGDSDHEALQVRHTGFQRVEKSAEMWNKKRNLTTLWLCTMATGKGQGTQNWPHTEAYDDGPWTIDGHDIREIYSPPSGRMASHGKNFQLLSNRWQRRRKGLFSILVVKIFKLLVLLKLLIIKK
jgi:hypothetical protein